MMMLKFVIAVILLSYPVFGSECKEGYGDCRAVNFAALDKELQSLLKDLPGGVFETEFKVSNGMKIGIKIKNINVGMGAEEVGVHWNTDEEGKVSEAVMKIQNFSANFAIHLEVDSIMKFCFWRGCRTRKADIYGGELSLDLEDAYMELEMKREGDKLKSGKCKIPLGKINELVIRSKRTEEADKTIGLVMRMLKGRLGSFLKGITGVDMPIPDEFMNILMDFVTDKRSTFSKPVPVCEMVESIFGLMNAITDKGKKIDILTEFIQKVKDNEEYFVGMNE